MLDWSRLRIWLSSERVQVTLVLFAFALISVLKGIRYPGLWAATHYTFSYEYGFIKRGLAGTVFYALLGDQFYKYNVLLSIISIIFAASLILLLSLSLRAYGRRKSFLFPALVLFSSPAMGFYAHIIGYFDQLGILVISLLLLKSRGWKMSDGEYFILILSCLCTLVLLHEVMAIFFGPLLFFSLMIRLQEGREAGIKFSDVRAYLIISVIILSGLVLAVDYYGTLDVLNLPDLLEHIRSRSDFPPRLDVFSVITTGAVDHTRNMSPIWSGSFHQRAIMESLLILAPSILSLMIFGYLLVKRCFPNSGLMPPAFIISCASPFFAHFLGWDIQRWNNMMVFTSFLAILVVYESRMISRHEDRPLPLYPLLVVIALNYTSMHFYFDGYGPKLYPFFEHIYHTLDIIHGRSDLIVRPPV
ncbi:MAG: hypothetical protein ABIH11_08990 [Candidatus Altiarchaeota archaeon]